MKRILFIFFALAGLCGCTKIYRTATPVLPKIYKHRYSTSANDLYYALRWALKSYGYPIAEEDLQNGVLKSRYVPVGATSHYVQIFDRKDFGITGAYHQLEIKLLPLGGQTEVQIGSRIQAVTSRIYSTGEQEKMIMSKVADYLRDPNLRLTNLGVRE